MHVSWLYTSAFDWNYYCPNYKENKAGNLSSGNNYRPIALANVISKVFESLIYRTDKLIDKHVT